MGILFVVQSTLKNYSTVSLLTLRLAQFLKFYHLSSSFMKHGIKIQRLENVLVQQGEFLDVQFFGSFNSVSRGSFCNLVI